MITLTFFGLSAITFFVGRIMPIDPVTSAAGYRVNQKTYDALYKEMGLDKSIPVQYLIFVKKALRGDFGSSFMTGQKVTDDIKRVFPASIELALIATLAGFLLGVPMGVIAAVTKGRLSDYIIRVIGLVGYSVPIFWMGIMSLVIFYSSLGWLSGPGRIDVYYIGAVENITNFIIIDALLAGRTDIALNALGHIILPASMLAIFSLAYIARMTRSFMLDQLNQEYVLTARVKGLTEWGVITRHVLPNIGIQLITVMALTFALLLEGSVLIETVFVWPGLGQYVIYAILAADMNAVIGGVTVSGGCFIILNQVSDLLYEIVDPRAR